MNKRLRVGFDARVIAWPGLGTYSRNLLEQFSTFPDLEVCCFYNDETGHLIPEADNLRKVPLNEKIFSRRNRKRINRMINECGCDIFHAPHPVSLTSPACPVIATIHDTIPLIYPRTVPLRLRRVCRSMLKHAVSGSDHIITAAEASRSSLNEHYSVDTGKITVILDGVSKSFSPRGDEEIKDTVSKYKLQQPFILWLGTFVPHKNVITLIEAFSGLAEPVTEGYTLVLAGNKTGDWEKTERAAAASGIGSRVHFPGFIDKEDLPALYSAAELFCFPSLYEGFGLPPLEAMACGTPVISSDSSSLPEVVGNSGLLVEPAADAFREAIMKVLTDEPMQSRLSQEGVRRASSFSWRRTAMETQALYRRVAAKQEIV